MPKISHNFDLIAYTITIKLQNLKSIKIFNIMACYTAT